MRRKAGTEETFDMLWLLPDTLESRDRIKKKYLKKRKKRENHAASCTLSVRFLMSCLTRMCLCTVIIQVRLPYIISNKNKCQKSNYFRWKKSPGMQSFLQSFLVMPAAAPDPAWASRSRGESREGKGRSCWLQGILGQGGRSFHGKWEFEVVSQREHMKCT